MIKRTSSIRALVILAPLFAASLLRAGDKPWNAKPYQSWDAKDVQQIMTDSPWVARTTVQRSWLLSQKDTVVQPEQPQISGGVRAVPNVMGTIQSNTGATDAQVDESKRQVNVYVYWYSSRLIRAASAREGVLRGVMDQSAVQKSVDAPQSDYEIVLRMDDMSPFIGKDQSFYQQNVFLQMRKGKLKLPPSKVRTERMGTTSEDIVFSFPKTMNGTPTIAGDETDVVFSCKVADQTVRVQFKPKKMVDQFGTDL